MHEHQRGEERSLSDVEGSPETILHYVAKYPSAYHPTKKKRHSENLLIRRSVVGTEHRAHAGSQTNTSNQPRVGGHQTIRPSIHVQSSSGDTNNTNTKSGVHESFIQIASLVVRHSAILSCFTVEDEVRSHDSATHNGRTVEQALGEVATLSCTVRRLHVSAPEGIPEGLPGLCED